MKKIISVLMIAAVIFNLSAKAQTNNTKSDNEFKLDAGLLGGIPGGNFGKETSFGLGIFANGAYTVATNVDVTLHAGFTTFWGKSYGGIKLANDHLFNILAGGSYNFDGGFHGDAGLGFCLLTGSAGFQYRIGGGYRFDKGIDVTLNYNGMSAAGETLGYIGIGVSYTIFGK